MALQNVGELDPPCSVNRRRQANTASGLLRPPDSASAPDADADAGGDRGVQFRNQRLALRDVDMKSPLGFPRPLGGSKN